MAESTRSDRLYVPEVPIAEVRRVDTLDPPPQPADPDLIAGRWPLAEVDDLRRLSEPRPPVRDAVDERGTRSEEIGHRLEASGFPLPIRKCPPRGFGQ